MILNDAANAKKAPTGPNPQGRLPAAENAGVASSGAQAGATLGTQPQQPPTPIGQKTTYDYSTDPALVNITAQQNLAIQQAQQEALAQQKQALIAYGDPNLALAVLGDKATAQAAQGNTASTLATLAAKNQANVRSTNESENKANLTYSSDRGYQLGLAQQAYLQDQATAATALQGTLGSANQSVLAAKQNAANVEATAQNAAYDRAIKNPIGVTQPNPHPSGHPISQLAAMLSKSRPGGLTTAPSRGVTSIH